MYTNEDKKLFIELIKDPIVDISKTNKILPSVIAAIAIKLSDFGTSTMYNRTNNIFKVPIDDNWNGWCYSEKFNHIYGNKNESSEISSVLYKSYVEPMESLKDFLIILRESKRSINGPYRYSKVFGHIHNTGYINAIHYLELSEFIEDYQNLKYTNTLWYNDLISIIENNKLYDWDEELIKMGDNEMSKKKKNKNNSNTIDNSIENNHIYRVRLSWEKPDTQIFASKKYEDAIECAMKHEGYKIFIDDDGELFENPWEKIAEEKVDAISIDGIKKVIHPIPGSSITLDNENIYLNAIDKYPYANISGTFYFYDNSIINNRAKITTKKNIIKHDPSLILGYIIIR